MKKHWFQWMRLHIHLRFIMISGIWKIHPLFIQRYYFDKAPVTIYRYFAEEPGARKMLRLDW